MSFCITELDGTLGRRSLKVMLPLAVSTIKCTRRGVSHRKLKLTLVFPACSSQKPRKIPRSAYSFRLSLTNFKGSLATSTLYAHPTLRTLPTLQTLNGNTTYIPALPYPGCPADTVLLTRILSSPGSLSLTECSRWPRSGNSAAVPPGNPRVASHIRRARRLLPRSCRILNSPGKDAGSTSRCSHGYRTTCPMSCCYTRSQLPEAGTWKAFPFPSPCNRIRHLP